MPTYNPNIPQPDDILSDSQDEILQNFQQINTVFGINHATFETANQGKHNIVTMPENAAPTATLANEASIYSQLSPLTAETELFWQREGGGDIIPWTASGIPLANNWTYLPSGIILKWGDESITGLNQPIVFPVAATIPVFSSIFQVFTTLQVVSGLRLTSNVIVGSATVAGFSVDVINTNTGAGATAVVSYLAIGV